MSSIKTISKLKINQGSRSVMLHSPCSTPTHAKKQRLTYQKQNITKKSSKHDLYSKLSPPVSRNKSSEKKKDINMESAKIKRKSSKPQKISTPIFRIPFDCVPSTKDYCQRIIETPNLIIKRSDFMFKSKIGSGGFGQVWKVQFSKNKRIYALKQISKIKVIMKKSVNSILNQKQILINLYNPFIINFKCSFQDRERLYLVVDYLAGGDLRYRLFHQKYFTQEETIGCIVIALQYLRENNIVHRDLKPENLVFEGNGYLRLTDFGVSRIKKQNNSEETSGTPGYMSPQVICKLNHSFEADYFALGIITYQLMLRKRPYNGNRKQIRDQILSRQIRLKKEQIPTNWNQNVIDFINRLLCRKKQRRLGYSSIEQIKKHPWMSSIDWSKLKTKQLKLPYPAEAIGQSVQYLKQVDISSSDTQNSLQCQQQKLLLRNKQIQDLFSDYNNYGCFQMYQQKYKYEKSTICTRDD